MEIPHTAPSGTAAPLKSPSITIGTASAFVEDAAKEVEITVYTVTLGSQTIELLPFKNWTQLDVHKWVVQGKLPAVPAGLEVTLDHVKIAGETVLTKDPEGRIKLERAFNEWLALEQGTLELVQKRRQIKPSVTAPGAKRPEVQPLHYQVQVDKEHQVHIHCLQGKEVLASIGLNVPGFSSLADQGLLRKPRAIKVGVLHDWVELDGVLYSFEKDNNDAAKLERALNERYLSNVALGQGKDVVVFANAASSTGFDMEFTALIGGVPDHRRRPLNEDTLELFQDPNKCGLLQQGLVIKLTRPTLIFKRKTPDGGERYLDKCSDNCVVVKSDTGPERIIDLSQPVNYLRLSAVELTAVFNHPVINKHGKAAARSGLDLNGPQTMPVAETHPTNQTEANQQVLSVAAETEPAGCTVGKAVQKESWMNTDHALFDSDKTPDTATLAKIAGIESASAAPDLNVMVPDEPSDSSGKLQRESVEPSFKALSNIWLKAVLEQPSIRFDWFTCLVYDEMAEHFGNSQQVELGPMNCWAVALSETEDPADPFFRGIFLTEKHGLGFINQGHVVRFYKGVAFIGNQDSALEGIGISLVGVGLDRQERIVFIVREDYLDKFDVAEQVLKSELTRLTETGAGILTVGEVLHSPIPFDIVWTVPADQQNPSDPQAVTSLPTKVFENRISHQGNEGNEGT